MSEFKSTSSMKASTYKSSSHRHHHHKRSPIEQFGHDMGKAVQDVHTWIATGVTTAVVIPVTCAVQKHSWLKTAKEFDELIANGKIPQ